MLRGFTDSTGVEWRVWQVSPGKTGDPDVEQRSRTSLKNTAYANDWLCFESSTEKRRLAPVPSGWEFRDTTFLEQMRDQAVPVRVRHRGRTA